MKEYNFDGMSEGDELCKNSNVFLTKMIYFRNPGCNYKFGTIVGNIRYRLISIEKLLSKYNIDQEIIDKCK